MTNPEDLAAYEILKKMILALVDIGSEAIIEVVPTARGAVFRVWAPDEAGKLIGKNGRTARSLRFLLDAIGAKAKRVYGLDIVPTKRLSAPLGESEQDPDSRR